MLVRFVSSRIRLLWILLAIPFGINTADQQRPNIVLIIADDLGWHDVGFHGSDQVSTPNIDFLAYSGMVLQQYYTHSQCTPSRTAMLTGKFAHRLGMQGYPIVASEDRGIPLTEKLLPQYLKELGFDTHLVGKWHVGHSQEGYLPNNRGFDSHFGHRAGYIDHYEYTSEETWTTGTVAGFDLYRNLTPAWDVEGYITDVYTAEAQKIIKSHDTRKPFFLQLAHAIPHAGNDGAALQAPHDLVRTMRHVEIGERRIYAAMVKKLDDSVGRIVETLEETKLLNNTIITFISDNGGMTDGIARNWGSNWPLRGIKMSPFEGGVRCVGLIWFNAMNFTNNVWKGKMHSVDWVPTLIRAVGGNKVDGIDGLDLWDSIMNGSESPRNEFFEIDDYTGYGAITLGEHKLITGEPIPSHSKQSYGNELNGLIGKPPSYEKVLENSAVNAVLRRLGKPLDIHLVINKRKKLVVDCRNFSDDEHICQPNKDKMCLFNIEEDPCESRDLSDQLPDLRNRLFNRLTEEWNRRLPRTSPMFRDPRSRPSNHNYTWFPWIDCTG